MNATFDYTGLFMMRLSRLGSAADPRIEITAQFIHRPDGTVELFDVVSWSGCGERTVARLTDWLVEEALDATCDAIPPQAARSIRGRAA